MLTALLHLHLTAAATTPPAVPNPAPTPIPGLQPQLDTIIGWGKWLLFFLGIIGLLICSGQMAIGRRNRHSFAADGAAGIPWVLGGLSLAAVSSGVVGVFLHP